MEEAGEKMRGAMVLTAFLSLATFVGCGAGNTLQRQGKASFAAGKYDDCLKQYDDSLTWWFSKASRPIKPGDDAGMLAGSIAQGYHGRAWCKYKKGQIGEAVVDIQY